MRLTPGDHVTDRRTGAKLRFSCTRRHNWLGIVAVCIVPGATGTRGRIKQVPIDRLRKAKVRA